VAISEKRKSSMRSFMCCWLVVVASTAVSIAADTPEKELVTAGEFVKIYDPSVGEQKPWYINDHCFIYGDEGKWHLFGITHEEPANPLDERNFAHATAGTLLQQPWDKQPFALSVATDAPWLERHLWAPHVIKHDGLYYMFYCGGDNDSSKYKIHLATSPDLKTWTRHPKNPMVVDGIDARDPFILRQGDHWLMYYTATSKPEGGNHVVACVSSKDLVTWGDKKVVFTDPTIGTFGGPTESPVVVQRGKEYYLFIGPRPGYHDSDVFVSTDPLHWDIENKVGHFPAHAAEVIRDCDGKWYISRAGWGAGGVFLAPLTWHDGLDEAETNMPAPAAKQ
jgi:arabinan endo-1,5-alpha-L-arabinosidase